MPNKKITFIDFAKGFSILTIVMMHYFQRVPLPGWLAKAVPLGGTGIHVFILLSGFGLALGQYRGWQHFLRRRATKILLPYYFFVTLLFIVNFFVTVHPKMDWYAYLGTLFFVQLIDLEIFYVFGIQFWFISTILQLYLLFPLLRIALNKLGNTRFLVICLGISLAYFGILYLSARPEHKLWSRFFPMYLWEFALGMVLARRFQTNQFEFWHLPAGKWVIGFVAGFGAMALLTFSLGDLGIIINDIPAMIGYLSITILLYQVCQAFAPLIEQAMLFIGKYSYPLYLIHIAVLQLFLYIQPPTPQVFFSIAGLLVYLLLTVGASITYDNVYQWVYNKSSVRQATPTTKN
ncbi:acyltransferase [uncultured Microscilla sp.]|uniref:acyltransferase family protein n=1 Tax=uncultured Microscilla sp. TaxID=432653 RepID=UPI002633195F|nr:acyltransferase [uncultured Microscilla sp.]